MELNYLMLMHERNHMRAFAKFIVIVLLIFPAIVFANNKLVGWGKTKWGMTQEEVKGMFKNKVVSVEQNEGATQDNIIILLKIENVKIDGIDFSVKFGFNKTSKKLQAVYLHAPTPEINEALYESLRKIIISKYGIPILKESDAFMGWNNRKEMWAVDKTRIDLILMISRDETFKVLAIKYSDRSFEENL